MNDVTRRIEKLKAKVKISDKDGKVSERECIVIGSDLLKEIKLRYTDLKIAINEMFSEENIEHMTYENFIAITKDGKIYNISLYENWD